MDALMHSWPLSSEPLEKSAEPKLECHAHTEVVAFVLDQGCDSSERFASQQVGHYDMLNPLLCEALSLVEMPVLMRHFFTFDADKVPPELLQAFFDVVLLHQL
jgi:hypothetical protein